MPFKNSSSSTSSPPPPSSSSSSSPLFLLFLLPRLFLLLLLPASFFFFVSFFFFFFFVFGAKAQSRALAACMWRHHTLLPVASLVQFLVSRQTFHGPVPTSCFVFSCQIIFFLTSHSEDFLQVSRPMTFTG